MPIELTREDIARIVQDHADATRRAVQAGFQLLELHAAHGYLVNTFLSPATNKRTDEYGGSFENRLRFPREVIAAMRAELGPKRLLCARLNGDDLLPGGLKIDEYRKVAPALVEAGLDLIHVSAGTYQAMEKRIPPMYLAGETFAGVCKSDPRSIGSSGHRLRHHPRPGGSRSAHRRRRSGLRIVCTAAVRRSGTSEQAAAEST